MERIRRRGLEVVLGIGVIAAFVIAITLILVAFSGGFSNKITVHAQLSSVGDELEQGDIVTYLDVIVGEVSSSAGKINGSAVATLRIDPHQAQRIPASVQAIAVPASLFGNTKIVLVPRTTDRGGPSLRDGDTVQADRSPSARSLQTALADAYTLLTSVHPAQLDAALSALATALQNNGPTLNTLIHKASAYLTKLAPAVPELTRTITDFATVTDHLAANAPSLLASLRDTLVVAKGIVRDRQAVDALLMVAPTAVDNAQALLSTSTVDNIVTVVRNNQPVTAALAHNPTALADTVHGFKTFADAFNQALSSGPYLRANVVLTGADFADLVAVAGGEQGRTFQSIVDPPEYTAADCPRYDGASGPNCSRATISSVRHQLLVAGQNYSGDSSIGSPGEVAVVRAAAQSITGLPLSQIDPVTADVLLGPLLRGSATVINP